MDALTDIEIAREIVRHYGSRGAYLIHLIYEEIGETATVEQVNAAVTTRAGQPYSSAYLHSLIAERNYVLKQGHQKFTKEQTRAHLRAILETLREELAETQDPEMKAHITQLITNTEAELASHTTKRKSV